MLEMERKSLTSDTFKVRLPCGEVVLLNRGRIEALSLQGDWRSLCYGKCKRYPQTRIMFECSDLRDALPLRGLLEALSR